MNVFIGMDYLIFIIVYCRKSATLDVPDLMEALMQYGDKFKALVGSIEPDGMPSETKLVSLMSGETYSLMAISPKDMMQQPKVRYVQVHCTYLFKAI